MGEEVINLSPIPRSEEKKIERDKEKEGRKGKKSLRLTLPELHGSIIYGPKLPQTSECKAESHRG